MFKPLIYVLLLVGVASVAVGKLSILETDTKIEIKNDAQSVLTYHKAVIPPPQGQPKYFERS